MVGKGDFVHNLFLFLVSASLVLELNASFQWNASGTRPTTYFHQKES